IVNSIAFIPDPITRSLYIKQTAKRLDVTESILITEINRLLRKKIINKLPEPDQSAISDHLLEIKPKQDSAALAIQLDASQERDIIRLLLDNSNNESEGENTVRQILQNLTDVEIETPAYQKIIAEYVKFYSKNEFITQAHFINHPDETLRNLAIDILQSPYELSDNWHKMHDVVITVKSAFTQKDILKTISLLKLRKVIREKMEIEQKIKEMQSDKSPEAINEITLYQKEIQVYQKIIQELSIHTGTVILPYSK
ncbi:MAG: hypothetical protein ACK4IY_09270, partial [Chitinophagales bacterium]